MEVSTDSTVQTINMYDYMNNSLLINPSLYIIGGIVLFLFVILFTGLGGSSSSSSSYSSTNSYSTTSPLSTDDGTNAGLGLVSFFFIGLVLLTVFLAGIHYFYGTTAFASLKNIFNPVPIIDLKIDQTHGSSSGPVDTSANLLNTINTIEKDIRGDLPSAFNGKQVFNIPGNYFGYEDSKTICAAYGARLANYDEVESAYNAGGEWCNYGWTDGQMALFPTQKKTYDTLQTIEGHEHDCGRPGVNGGYMANPKMKFGVNCYGVKPEITSEEKELMDNTTPYPKTEKDIKFEKDVAYWKKNLNKLLVSPFNNNEWSRY